MTPAKTTALALHQPRGQLPTTAEPEDIALFAQVNRFRASIHDDDWLKKLAAFRDLYGLSSHDNSELGPLREQRSMLHRRLLAEEFSETIGFNKAETNVIHQLVGVTPRPPFEEEVDGVLDLIYVGLGILLEMGLSPAQINLLMEEVHASNMTKTDAEGKPIYDDTGKVLKGDNYKKADIAGLLRQFRLGL